jgi:hypothetical protein
MAQRRCIKCAGVPGMIAQVCVTLQGVERPIRLAPPRTSDESDVRVTLSQWDDSARDEALTRLDSRLRPCGQHAGSSSWHSRKPDGRQLNHSFIPDAASLHCSAFADDVNL